MAVILLSCPYQAIQDYERYSLAQLADSYRDVCFKDAIKRGDTPVCLASSLTSLGVTREEGLDHAKNLLTKVDKLVLYVDHGLTEGMKELRDYAKKNDQEVEYRRMFDEWDK
jgi:hypothetical protein